MMHAKYLFNHFLNNCTTNSIHHFIKGWKTKWFRCTISKSQMRFNRSKGIFGIFTRMVCVYCDWVIRSWFSHHSLSYESRSVITKRPANYNNNCIFVWQQHRTVIEEYNLNLLIKLSRKTGNQQFGYTIGTTSMMYWFCSLNDTVCLYVEHSNLFGIYSSHRQKSLLHCTCKLCNA